jgi:hypothetical protein
MIKVRTILPYQQELSDILDEHKIPYKISRGDGKGSLYQSTIDRFSLPPYEEPSDYKTNNIIFNITKEHKDTISNIPNMRHTIKLSYRYKTPRYDIEYKFNSTRQPTYPIYVVSYGRYDVRDMTIDHLEKIGVPYTICIQKRETDQYSKSMDEFGWNNGTLLISEDTDQGSYIQRNKCWEDSIRRGYDHFWLLDDNIKGWSYFNYLNEKIVHNPMVFTIVEDFLHNIQNSDDIKIISHSYSMDVRKNELRQPFQVNTKNYSSCLIDNRILQRFRLKYNEDVDLTLQILETGYKTIGFNMIVSHKCPTGSVKGGNSTTIYSDNNETLSQDKMKLKYTTLKDSWENHPIIYDNIKEEIKHKDQRSHHKVNYRQICKSLGNDDRINPMNSRKMTYEDYDIIVLSKTEN